MKPGSLFARLLTAHLVVTFAVLAVLGVTLDRVFERRALDDLKARLVAEARTVSAVVIRDGSAQEDIRRLSLASGARLTIIRPDGIVLADSEHDPATMENHSDRPEVRAALSGRIGADQRVSDTLGAPYLYVALRAENGVVVRAALPAGRVAAQQRAVRISMLLALIGSAAIAALISGVVARTVGRPLAKISDQVGRVSRGEFEAVDPAGPREARALADAVNAMASDLAAHVERLRNETELRDQILSTMSEAVILADADGVVYANPAARALFGIAPSDALPPSIPSSGSGETVLHHPNRRDVRFVTARTGADRLLVVAQDVTDSKRIDQIRRDFVADASHEMKTPVAGILATAETLRDAVGDDPESAKRFSETIVKETKRLSVLINDLLSLARLEQPEGTVLVVSWRNVVREAVDEMRERAAAAGIALTDDIASDIAVPGRAEDLSLLARNLLDNAIRYTPSGGSVRVALRKEGDRAILEVADTGAGIPQKDLPRIFERFFRVDQARSRDTGGTGLGLAIVRHVAESHGGTVAAESELGKGSTFTVSLPLA